MVGLRKSGKAGGSRILLREEVFMPEFTPVELCHREAEVQAITEGVTPLFEGGRPENFFVHGVSGNGKTTCVNYLLKQLAEGSSRVKCVYVNCWRYSTRMAVYSRITETLGDMQPRRGLATDEVFSRIVEVMEKSNVRLLVVLDELDGLFFRKEEKLLYDLSRSSGGKPLFGLVGISSNRHLLDGKDARLRNSMRLTEFEFKPYGLQQMNAILKGRAEAGLAPDSWDLEVIGACARKAVNRASDVCLGLSLVWKAARLAERAGRTRLTVEDVENADETILGDSRPSKGPDARRLDERYATLCKEERLIVELLGSGVTSSSELYARFNRKMIKSKRQIRFYLAALEAKKLVLAERVPSEFGMIDSKRFKLSFGVIEDEGRIDCIENCSPNDIEPTEQTHSDCDVRSYKLRSPRPLISGC